MTVSPTQIQLLRTTLNDFRPDPGRLLEGQPAINLSSLDGGLFFTDTNGGLMKIGPCAVTSSPPNTNPAGQPGNSRGELWFDVNDQTLKIWTGDRWADCDPAETGISRVVIQTTPPLVDSYPNGALWWNDYNGEMYVLYEDPNGRQWVQVGAGGGGSGGAVIISDQQPDPSITSAGALWWNDDTGSLFILFNDGGPEKLWIQIAGAGAINGGQGGSVSKIDVGTGLATLNGQPITTQGTLLLKPATTNEIGGVKPGSNITIEPDGTINAIGDGTGTVTTIQTGPGITGGPITTTGTIGLATATSNTLGGVTPGAGTGVTTQGALFIEPASTSSIGGVIVGQGLNITVGGVLAVDEVPPGFLPAGTVQWFAGSTAPTGWRYCNGAVLDTGSFPALYAAIGRTYTGTSVPPNQFQIPDLRGQFLRGWDNRATGGVDSGRVFGSFQNDEFKAHTHSYIDNKAGGFGLTTTGFSAEQEAQTGSTGGSETRPKNIALLPIIKI
jgi:microcystin-dependent protein